MCLNLFPLNLPLVLIQWFLNYIFLIQLLEYSVKQYFNIPNQRFLLRPVFVFKEKFLNLLLVLFQNNYILYT